MPPVVTLSSSSRSVPQSRRESSLPGSENGFLIEGVTSRRVLRGKSVFRTLPQVLPLLDGTRHWGEISHESGLDIEQLRDVLSVLFSAGLLEEGPSPSDASTRQLFLARAVDATRHNASGVEAADRLDRARVVIIGRHPVSNVLEKELTRLQVENIRLEADQTEMELADLAVAVGGPGIPHPDTRRLRRLGVPVLIVTLDEGRAVIGPVSYPDHGPCAKCLIAQTSVVTGKADPHLEMLLAPALATEIVLLLARVGQANSSSRSIVIESRPFRTKTVFMPSLPSCTDCGLGDNSIHSAPLALQFEMSVAFPPIRLNNPRTHQNHYEASNIELSFEQREFPTETFVPLPALTVPMPEPRGGLTVETLGEVLGFSFGFKKARTSEGGGKVLRWSPTGGNLGSPQAYLEAKGIPGLENGNYAYRARDHSLAMLPQHSGASQVGIGTVRVIVVSELNRVWKKYATFSYRVVNLDAGVALTHMLLIAQKHSIPVRNQTHWDEELIAAQFDVDLVSQAVTAQIVLG